MKKTFQIKVNNADENKTEKERQILQDVKAAPVFEYVNEIETE